LRSGVPDVRPDMTTIIIDTDFLSSILKIGQSDLVRSLYATAQIRITIAVYRELARTNLLSDLLALKWIEVDSMELSPTEPLLGNPTFRDLGAGEQSCIVLARATTDHTVLMSDNKARAFAQSLGLTVLNLPAFLLACKYAGLLNRTEMGQIVQDLKDKDFYEFKADVRAALLS
jgi:predicted nucleic acid-binding protein